MKLTMRGRLTECLLLSYRTPEESVRHLVPSKLCLTTHNGWAFWNIVVSRIERMRPQGCPRWAGITYHHVAYRLYVHAETSKGRQEGLYFLRSDADNPLVAIIGNEVTDFRFHGAFIDVRSYDCLQVWRVHTRDDSGDALLAVTDGTESLVEDSCFDSMDEARKFLKYVPMGLSIKNGALSLAEVRRNEAEWREIPVDVGQARWSFLDNLGQQDLRLERAIRVPPLEYRWRLGSAT